MVVYAVAAVFVVSTAGLNILVVRDVVDVNIVIIPEVGMAEIKIYLVVVTVIIVSIAAFILVIFVKVVIVIVPYMAVYIVSDVIIATVVGLTVSIPAINLDVIIVIVVCPIIIVIDVSVISKATNDWYYSGRCSFCHRFDRYRTCSYPRCCTYQRHGCWYCSAVNVVVPVWVVEDCKMGVGIVFLAVTIVGVHTVVMRSVGIDNLEVSVAAVDTVIVASCAAIDVAICESLF